MDPASLPSGAVVLVVVILVLAAVTVFGIAAVTVGREAHRLDAVAPRAVYVLDEAVEYVSDELPAAAQARLTPTRCARCCGPTWPRCARKGLQPPVAVDQVQEIVDPVVVDETDAVAYLIDQAERPAHRRDGRGRGPRRRRAPRVPRRHRRGRPGRGRPPERRLEIIMLRLHRRLAWPSRRVAARCVDPPRRLLVRAV